MKILCVYFSQKDNTQYVVNIIHGETNCAIQQLPIIDKETKTKINEQNYIDNPLNLETEPTDYDLVIIGTSTKKLALPEAVEFFLTHYANKLNKVAFFCITNSLLGHQYLVKMASLCSRIPLGTLLLSNNELNDRSHIGTIKDFVNRIIDPLELL